MVAAVLFGMLSLSAQAQTKVGIVDLRKIFDGYYKTKLADANLKESAADKDKQLKELTDSFKKGEEEWKKLVEKANDQAVASTEREKSKAAADKKLLELRELEQTVNQFTSTAKTQLTDQRGRMRDKILVEIQEKIAAKAKAGSFTLILDTASETLNKTPVILYNNGENDLTDAILTQLNASQPVTTPAPVDKK
ncbi:MAG: hlpA [Verrucomicrobiales bacterium]|nr:hlpA [Verrucomicrobiales bacterium]